MNDVVQRLRELSEQASNGPWWWDGRDVFHKPTGTNLDQVILPFPSVHETFHPSQGVREQDARLVVAMRNALPALLDIAEAAAKVERIYEGLRTDESDGSFALWSEDQLVVALHALRPTLARLAEQP